MKFLLLALLSLTFISCAHHDQRDPASAEEKKDVSRGINADYFGGSFR